MRRKAATRIVELAFGTDRSRPAVLDVRRARLHEARQRRSRDYDTRLAGVPANVPVDRKGPLGWAPCGSQSGRNVDSRNRQPEPETLNLFALLHQIELAEKREPVRTRLSRVGDHAERDCIPGSFNALAPRRNKTQPLIFLRRIYRALDLRAHRVTVHTIADERRGTDEPLSEEVAECR